MQGSEKRLNEMETLITSIHIFVAVFMILVVLIQGGNQGGMSAAFGGGNSQGFFGASGATTLLGKLTYIAAAIFMITSLWLTVLKGNVGDIGLTEKLKSTSTSSPAATANPATPESTAPAAGNPAPTTAAPAQPAASNEAAQPTEQPKPSEPTAPVSK
jgi:preprotein translocase subunit SecG